MNIDQVKKIIVHANCSDGKASAMILNHCLPGRQIIEMVHNSKAHLELAAEEGLLFCDFAPHQSRLEEFFDAGTIVLDHHKTVKNEVLRFQDAGLGAFGDEQTDIGVCGAVLAFEHVAKKTIKDAETLSIMEGFSRLVGIRDTWVKNSPNWKEACEQSSGIFFFPTDKLLAMTPGQWIDSIPVIGQLVFERQLLSAKHCLENSFSFVSAKGTKCIMITGTTSTSDASDVVGSDVDILAGFNFAKTGDNSQMAITFSCRSKHYDVSSLAKMFGGGGHTLAAGFNIKLSGIEFPNPIQIFLEALDKHECSK